MEVYKANCLTCLMNHPAQNSAENRLYYTLK